MSDINIYGKLVSQTADGWVTNSKYIRYDPDAISVHVAIENLYDIVGSIETALDTINGESI